MGVGLRGTSIATGTGVVGYSAGWRGVDGLSQSPDTFTIHLTATSRSSVRAAWHVFG